MKYNYYILQIQVLKIFIGSLCDDITLDKGISKILKKNSIDKRDAKNLLSCRKIKLKFILD